MRKLSRRSWLLASVLLAAVIGAGYLLVPVRESRISRANCDKIQVGWTKTQLEALLGDAAEQLFLLTTNPVLVEASWQNDDGDEIKVTFDRSVRTMRKRFTPTTLSLFEVAKRRIVRRLRALRR
jgi:hypothetical protein